MSRLDRTIAEMYVTSHVARDLLQSAALFKNEHLVVWEYVSNGLQYVDPGTIPVISVSLDSLHHRITVTDNGRGMRWPDLQNYFVMHGVNLDRLSGRKGRGRFGTGKSAAFGIAELLRVTSVRDKRRSVVELTRGSIVELDSGAPIPVRVIERETPVSANNGTMIEIEGVRLKSIDQTRVIRYIERHLARWPRGSIVTVNHHQCEYAEPPVDREFSFVADGQTASVIGPVALTIKTSKIPLDDELRGIAVYANGVWCETTLAGSDGREMTQYIFGDVDVPRLDDDSDPIPAIDHSRSMRLNPNNEIVRALYTFIGPKIDMVRRQLVDADRQRRHDEEARRLDRQANEIARVINEDFMAYRQKLRQVRASQSGSTDMRDVPHDANADDDDFIYGNEEPALEVSPTGSPGVSSTGTAGDGTEPRRLLPSVEPAQGDAPRQGRRSPASASKRDHTGGFAVQFRGMGSDGFRALYVADERTIYINLDHPQLTAARGTASTDDPTFRRLAYEVAFSEYAVALASELAARDEYIDPSDPIVDIRETLNRIARRSAHLYSA